jgi:uncharacterized protein
MSSPGMSLEALCRHCRFCCDGTLFAKAPLQPDEVASARRHSLEVITRSDGSPAIRQPCSALGPDGCGAYDERPSACRSYRCLLFGALAEGEVSFDEALRVVDETRARLGTAEGDALLAREFRGRSTRR